MQYQSFVSFYRSRDIGLGSAIPFQRVRIAVFAQEDCLALEFETFSRSSMNRSSASDSPFAAWIERSFMNCGGTRRVLRSNLPKKPLVAREDSGGASGDKYSIIPR